MNVSGLAVELNSGPLFLVHDFVSSRIFSSRLLDTDESLTLSMIFPDFLPLSVTLTCLFAAMSERFYLAAAGVGSK